VATRRTKTERINERQAKVAALREAEAARKRRVMTSFVAVGLVAVVLVALVVAYVATNKSTSNTGSGSSAAAAPVADKVASVPGGTFDSVGAGNASTPPRPIKGAPPLKQGSKPKVLYMGAEYCPYCAAERWAVAAALSRFGTFHNLGQTHSSSADVYPSTPTLSFHGATYSSKYLAFNGYELQSNVRQGTSYAPLDHPPAADQQLFQKYDAPPYVSSQTAGSIPFIDFGGKYMIQGASYNPGLLKGMTHQQVADAMHDPNSPVAKSVIGTANLITAALCKQTGDQPGDVCSSSGVTAAASHLK
jgi:thiol-disulfide isomerase/thioredoxin